MRGIAVGILALALLTTAVSGSVLLLFTTAVFDALGFHPVALKYFNGYLTGEEIRLFSVAGQRFTEAEISHLDDVRLVLATVSRVFLAAFVVCAVALYVSIRTVAAAARAALGLVAVVAILVVVAYFTFGFDAVGSAFHEIVFPQGNWRFSFQSLIIRLYGTSVMIEGSVFVIALSVGGLAALTLMLWAVNRAMPPASTTDRGRAPPPSTDRPE